jgi:hypothetical protein
MCDDVQLCNRCVCEFLILARTWFTFGLPSKTGCDSWQVKTSLECLPDERSRCCVYPTLPAWISSSKRFPVSESMHFMKTPGAPLLYRA